MKSFILFFFVMFILSFTEGCDSASQSYPSDNELIAFFKENKELFVELRSDPQNQELVSSLKINRIFVRSTNPQTVWYEIWFKDLFGAGGCMKGYAFSEHPPDALVESIDGSTDPCGPEERLLYKKIGGNWYLFYHSLN